MEEPIGNESKVQADYEVNPLTSGARNTMTYLSF
jgi:hypothetical protein